MPKAEIKQNILNRLFIFTITFLPLISGCSKAPEKNPDIEDRSIWTEAIDPGFNNKNNYAVVAMAEYNGYFYAVTRQTLQRLQSLQNLATGGRIGPSSASG